jgi:hypothetical protein
LAKCLPIHEGDSPPVKNRVDEAVDRLDATNDEVKAELRSTRSEFSAAAGD